MPPRYFDIIALPPPTDLSEATQAVSGNADPLGAEEGALDEQVTVAAEATVCGDNAVTRHARRRAGAHDIAHGPPRRWVPSHRRDVAVGGHAPCGDPPDNGQHAASEGGGHENSRLPAQGLWLNGSELKGSFTAMSPTPRVAVPSVSRRLSPDVVDGVRLEQFCREEDLTGVRGVVNQLQSDDLHVCRRLRRPLGRLQQAAWIECAAARSA